MNDAKRVDVIDGFRFLAVISVMSYHFFSRFAPPISEQNYYPYFVEYSRWISHGYYGVQFFFVISGFVIAQTLGTCAGMGDFYKRRLIRLMPTLILCSSMTFFFVKTFSLVELSEVIAIPKAVDFLPSLSFIPPGIWNVFLRRGDISYIDGVYWSLQVEIIFYLCAALIYFKLPRHRFLLNWVTITLAIQLLRIITSPNNIIIPVGAVRSFATVFYNGYFALTLNYWPYFALGIMFYELYYRRKSTILSCVLMAILVVLEFYFLGDDVLRILFSGIILLFLIFIYKPQWLKALTFKPLIQIGLASYPLYLVHENIGLILIHRLSSLLGPQEWSWVAAVATGLILILFTYFLYRMFELPVTALLRDQVNRKESAA